MLQNWIRRVWTKAVQCGRVGLRHAADWLHLSTTAWSVARTRGRIRFTERGGLPIARDGGVRRRMPEQRHSPMKQLGLIDPMSYGQKIETAEERGVVPTGVDLPGRLGYVFWSGPIADRLAGRTNELGEHPDLRHGDGGPRAAENRFLKAN
jgi:hypothetical protein